MTRIGGRLDALGVDADIDDGDLIISAVVVMSVLPKGGSGFIMNIASSESISWIEQAGLLRLAERLCNPVTAGDDD